ncbi:MAG: RES family NAD+ phosphorylase [Bryobacteraceae bacterium]|nr:RES family NAD+ phosphorylase [Bryobacteraceae bacterium]
MKLVYRLCNAAYPAASGEGACQYGGRWNPVGVPAVYAAESRALCIMERLVHLVRLPRNEVLTRIAIPDRVATAYLSPDDLPSGWDDSTESSAIQSLAGKALAEVAVLRVPSVIVPGEFCYVLNPEPAHFPQIRFEPSESFRYDQRLIREFHSVS